MNIARLINGVSALILSLLPGKTNILEWTHDWELRPTSRGPRLPRWMEKRGGAAGNMSVNQFVNPLLTIRFLQTKDYVLQRTTDRRRRVIEDLHLAIEIFIESAFEIAHKAGHFLLSPSEVVTIGDTDPTPTERRCTLHYTLDTDARTWQDVIAELGYWR